MKGPTSPTDRAKNHRFARPPPTPPRSAAAGRLIQSPPPKKRHPRLQKTSGAASGESGIRTHGDISTTLDFESSALDQLSHLSLCVRSNAAVLCTQRSALSSTFLVKHATSAACPRISAASTPPTGQRKTGGLPTAHLGTALHATARDRNASSAARVAAHRCCPPPATPAAASAIGGSTGHPSSIPTPPNSEFCAILLTPFLTPPHHRGAPPQSPAAAKLRRIFRDFLRFFHFF